MEHAKLMVHAGGVRVTREDLVKFQTPAATATWRPCRITSLWMRFMPR